MSRAESSVHDFEFILAGADVLTDEIIDALYEAGCDDASLSACGSTLCLSFHRAAPSYDEAVASARSDVARAGVGLSVASVVKLAAYSFRVVLSGVTDVTAEIADALYGGGCDDAGVGSCEGVVTVNFDREAESLGSAIGSAVDDVGRAGFAVARVEVDR